MEEKQQELIIYADKTEVDTLRKKYKAVDINGIVEKAVMHYNRFPFKAGERKIYLETIKEPLTLYNTAYKEETIKEKEKVVKKLEVWTLKDFRENVKKPKDIIENLLQKDELGMIYGDSGVRKSLLTSYLALCIATGKPAFNKYKVKKQPVLILTAENGNLITKVHFDTLMKGLRVRYSKSICSNLKVLRRDACENLLDREFCDEIINYLNENNIKVLFLDTLAVLVPEKDLSQAPDSIFVLKNVFHYLKANVKDLSIYYLEHTDKNKNSYIGSIKQKGNLDVQFRIERETPEDLTCNTLLIYNEKGRIGEEGVLKIEVKNFGNPNKLAPKIKDTTQFSFISIAPPKIYEKSDSIRFNKNDKRILGFLKEKKSVTRQELIKLTGISVPTLDRRLKGLVINKKITNEAGVYSLK